MGASRKREGLACGLAPKFSSLSLSGWGGGGTPLQEANREVPLEGVAFSRLEPDYNGVAFSIDLLEWGRKFWDFRGKYGFKIGRLSVKNQKVDVY